MNPLQETDLPTRAPAVVACRTGPKDGNYWEYISLNDGSHPDQPWWSDGSELGISGRPADVIWYVNRYAHEWRILH